MFWQRIPEWLDAIKKANRPHKTGLHRLTAKRGKIGTRRLLLL
jgi:hypothetical protein